MEAEHGFWDPLNHKNLNVLHAAHLEAKLEFLTHSDA